MKTRWSALLILIALLIAVAVAKLSGSRSLINDNYHFAWVVDESAQTIEYTITVNHEKPWIGIGLTKNREVLMASASMVIVTFEGEQLEPKIGCFKGDKKNGRPLPVSQACYATLQSATVQEGKTTVVIKRALAVAKGTEDFNTAIVDGPNFVIVAYGTNGNLTCTNSQVHALRQDEANGMPESVGSVAVNFWDSDLILPSFSNTSIIYGSRTVNPSYALNWWSDPLSGLISFQILAATKGWFAMAIAPSTNMVGAAITQCSFDGTAPSVANWFAEVNGKKPQNGPFQYYTRADAGHYNNVAKLSSCTFTRSLASQNAKFDAQVKNATLSVLWAFGKDSDTKFEEGHGSNKGSYSVNFLNDKNNDVPYNPKYLLNWLHGGFMIFAWAVCASLGIFVARFSKRQIPKFYRHIHMAIFIIALAASLIGFILAWARSHWKFEFHNPHQIMGFIIVGASVIQPIIGFIADRCFNPNRRGIPCFPDKIHWYLGRSLWIASMLNIYLGLIMVTAPAVVLVAFYIWVVFLIAVFVFDPASNNDSGAYNNIQYADITPSANERTRLV